MSNSRLVETEPLDLKIGGQSIRVVCEDPEGAAQLHDALADELVSDEAPLGFLLSAPTARQRLYVLTDRSGFVLARTRLREHALAILGGHLSVLNAPRPGTVRLRTRALAGPDDSIVLAPWPVLYAPPVVERRLAQIGYRLIDRLCIDIEPASSMLHMNDVSWDPLGSMDPGPGHLPSPGSGAWPVTSLLSPGYPESGAPTKAQLVHFLASLGVRSGARAQLLDAAELLTAGIRTRFVRLDEPSSLYSCLAQEARESSGRGARHVEGPPGQSGAAPISTAIEQSYDELSYGSDTYPATHPIELSTTAELRGLATRPVDDCSVLELGCAEGGNLIPLAEAFPNSRFVGVELSSEQIDRGRDRIRALCLDNVELHRLDLLAVMPSLGRFDYIICHGVFSWVPPEAQAKVLEICRDNASESAVSYVSYNTYPGWHLRMVLRKLMLEAGDEEMDLLDRVAAAREALGRLIDDVDHSSGYGAMVKAEANLILDCPDSYIAHDYLAPINEPLYHHEFVQRATAAGLRLLGDHAVRSNPTLMGSALISANPADPRRQEYQDLVRNTGFRAAVLCREEATLDLSRVSTRLADFHVSTPMIAKSPTGGDGAGSTFVDPRDDKAGFTLEIDPPALVAAMLELEERAPASLSVRKLSSLVQDRLRNAPDGVTGMLVTELVRFTEQFGQRAVHLSVQPYPFVAHVSRRPMVGASARAQAKTEAKAASRRHDSVSLSDPMVRFLVQRLDGSCTVDDLVMAVADAAAEGAIILSAPDRPESKFSTDSDRVIRPLVVARLEFLRRNAMLIA